MHEATAKQARCLEELQQQQLQQLELSPKQIRAC